jgi:hypothetical protein
MSALLLSLGVLALLFAACWEMRFRRARKFVEASVPTPTDGRRDG